MIDEENKTFAEELMKKYGEDRFYHSCHRTSGNIQTSLVYMALNENHENINAFFNSIGLPACGGNSSTLASIMEPLLEPRTNMCRIAFGFCRYWKEFGLKTHKLPFNLHARMVFGDKNEWVENYIKLLDKFPDWQE